MTTLTSLSQGSKTVPIEVETIENVKRFVDKCDSLRISYDKLIKEKQKLSESVLKTIAEIEELKIEKANLKQQLTDVKSDFSNPNTKRLGLDIQIGMQPTFIENTFGVKPYAGIGISWRVFSL